MTTIFVNKATGNDANNGIAAPVRTLGRAAALVRAALPSATTRMTVWVAAGRYTAEDVQSLTTDDGGPLGVDWVFRPGAVMSTSEALSTFTVDPATGLWVSNVPAGRQVPTLFAGNYMLRYAPYRGGGGVSMPLRVSNWDLVAKTATIPAAPFVGLSPTEIANLRIVFHLGWNISIVQPQSITITGANATFVHRPLDRIMEFTKGRVSPTAPNPTEVPNMSFGFGPYLLNQTALEARNHKAWVTEPGDFYFDEAAAQVYVYPVPEGLDWWNANCRLPGTVQTFFNVRGAQNVRLIDPVWEEIAWAGPTGGMGYIGYNANIYFMLTERVGSPGVYDYSWQRIPPLVDIEDVSNFTVIRPQMRKIGGPGIRGGKGLNGVTIDGLRAADIWSTPTYINSEHVQVLRTSPVSQWTRNIRIRDYSVENVGAVYSGDGLFVGSASDVLIEEFRSKWTSSSGINLGWGSLMGTSRPQEKVVVRRFVIDQACAVQIDDGGIYANGFFGVTNPTAPPTAPIPDGLQIYAGIIRNVRSPGLDPFGGFANGIYMDLGTRGTWVQGVRIENCDVGIKENSTRWHTYDCVDLVNCKQDFFVSYSGYNEVFDDATPTRFYRGPVNRSDTVAWDGGTEGSPSYTVSPLKNLMTPWVLEQAFRQGFGNVWASSSRMTRVGGCKVAPPRLQ